MSLASPAEHAGSAKEPDRCRVLIVDDDQDLLVLLQAVFASEKFESSTVEDGESALSRISRERPDLVLLDLMMPVMDGWNVLDRLLEEAVETPVIVVSAKTGQSDLIKAFEKGATEYVTKPFDPEDLLQRIHEVLGESATDRSARRSRRLAAVQSSG
jgi:DNA-binding response OmpR family regulator